MIIIDYNAGNIKSVKNMLKKIGVKSAISSNPDDVLKAEKIILPGVGAYDHGVKNLKKSDIFQAIIQAAKKGTPILGICLGAQLLGLKSEEGSLEGLGLVDMTVKRFELPHNLKVPHMGWSELNYKKPSKITTNLEEDSRFYFVHSYHFQCNNKNDVLATCNYGYDFVCSIEKENIYGMQFHPEKSHRYGMQLLRNFASL